MVHLNALDALMLAYLIYKGYQGYNRGFVMTILPFVYWTGIVVAAILLMKTAGDMVFTRFLKFSGSVSALISFAILIALGVAFSKKAIDKGAGLIGKKLSFANQLTGLATGVIKGVFLMSILFMALKSFNVPKTELRNGSFFYGSVSQFAGTVWSGVSSVWPQAEGLADLFRDNLKS